MRYRFVVRALSSLVTATLLSALTAGCGSERSPTSSPSAALPRLVLGASTSAGAPAPSSAQAPPEPASASSAPGPAKTVHIEVFETMRAIAVVREPVRATETVADTCARLTIEARFTAIATPPQSELRCGAEAAKDAWSPAAAVRSFLVSSTPLLTEVDFRHAEVWFDEDTSPAHAHVVIELTGPALSRLRVFAKAHPASEIATAIDGIVAEVQVARDPGDEARFWITPPVPTGAVSNAETANEISASLREHGSTSSSPGATQ